MDLLAHLRKNPFVLAPMAGITDCSFRSFMREMGCGVMITELVSATGLQFNSAKTRKLMKFDQCQHPIGIQIFGEDPEMLSRAAQAAEQLGADFVDLNLGCPVPKVVKKGAGAAILKDLVTLRNILRAIKGSVGIPVTIKVRTGWDEKTRNTEDVVRVAHDEGITWVAIHGRTRAAGYSGKADWEYIKKVKQVSPIPVLGNGDIHSAEQACDRLKQSACDGVMIGRGCLKNPWIFQEALSLWKNRKKQLLQDRDFLKLLERLNYHLEQHCENKLVLLQVKKFSAWYSSGYPGAAAFRGTIFKSKSKIELRQKVSDFFTEAQNCPPSDTSSEPFLMGGHG